MIIAYDHINGAFLSASQLTVPVEAINDFLVDVSLKAFFDDLKVPGEPILRGRQVLTRIIQKLAYS